MQLVTETVRETEKQTVMMSKEADNQSVALKLLLLHCVNKNSKNKS